MRRRPFTKTEQDGSVPLKERREPGAAQARCVQAANSLLKMIFSQPYNILCRQPFLALDDAEFDFFSGIEIPVGGNDLGEVHKHVGQSLALYETKTFSPVKPLHHALLALHHVDLPDDLVVLAGVEPAT